MSRMLPTGGEETKSGSALASEGLVALYGLAILPFLDLETVFRRIHCLPLKSIFRILLTIKSMLQSPRKIFRPISKKVLATSPR